MNTAAHQLNWSVSYPFIVFAVNGCILHSRFCSDVPHRACLVISIKRTSTCTYAHAMAFEFSENLYDDSSKRCFVPLPPNLGQKPICNIDF